MHSIRSLQAAYRSQKTKKKVQESTKRAAKSTLKTTNGILTAFAFKNETLHGRHFSRAEELASVTQRLRFFYIFFNYTNFIYSLCADYSKNEKGGSETMPKWTSALFSDIRNALGDSVIFSIWKGRSYFRSYAIPANPRTNPQTAQRVDHSEAVDRYQALAQDTTWAANMNAYAAAWNLPGFNRFMTEYRKSDINPNPKNIPSSGGTVTITYSTAIKLDDAKIVVVKPDNSTEEFAVSASSGSVEHIINASDPAGDYTYWLVNAAVLDSGSNETQVKNKHIDEATGTTVLAVVTKAA